MEQIKIFASIFQAFGVALIPAVVALWGLVRKTEIERRKPDQIVHNCRICGLDVYSYIRGGSKKQTPPLCAYLDSSDWVTCCFNPEENSQKFVMKETNNGQCYIALFNGKFELK